MVREGGQRNHALRRLGGVTVSNGGWPGQISARSANVVLQCSIDFVLVINDKQI